MKTILAIVALLAVGLISFNPAVVAAEDMECPAHGMNTIQSLAMCVQHAVSIGAITRPGVADSLLAKVSAAQSSVDRGEPAVAANTLQPFISGVRAQSGVHIEAEHAQHLITHAGQNPTFLRFDAI